MNNQTVFNKFFDTEVAPEIPDSKKLTEIFLKRFNVYLSQVDAIRLWTKYSMDYEGISWLTMPDEEEVFTMMKEFIPGLEDLK